MHYTKDDPHHEEVNTFFKGTSQPAMLTNPLPPHQQQMVAQNPTPPKGGYAGHPSQGYASTNTHVLMCVETINLTTHENTYDIVPDKYSNGGAPDQPSTSTTPPLCSSLHIERHVFDLVLRPPKNTIHKSTFNPSSHVAHKYNIVEDLV